MAPSVWSIGSGTKKILVSHLSLSSFQFLRIKRCQRSYDLFVEEAKRGSWNILQSLLVIHQCGKELLMEKTSVSNMCHVDAHLCVGNNALAYRMELAVKNIVGMSPWLDSHLYHEVHFTGAYYLIVWFFSGSSLLEK